MATDNIQSNPSINNHIDNNETELCIVKPSWLCLSIQQSLLSKNLISDNRLLPLNDIIIDESKSVHDQNQNQNQQEISIPITNEDSGNIVTTSTTTTVVVTITTTTTIVTAATTAATMTNNNPKSNAIPKTELHPNDDNNNNNLGLFLGLFANTNIQENTEIGHYFGDLLNTRQAIQLKDKSYLMRLGPQYYINSNDNHLHCKMRYINDCRNPAGYNVQFLKMPEVGIAKVITTRSIKCGEEIFVDYGRWYWLGCDVIPVRLSFHILNQLKQYTCD